MVILYLYHFPQLMVRIGRFLIMDIMEHGSILLLLMNGKNLTITFMSS